MSRILRAQLSLNFSDESVFDGLVIPLKQNKELNATVERLLSSYFYSEQVRGLVDGFDINEAKSLLSDIDTKRDEAFKSAKETLAMMSMLSASARSTMEDGIEDIMTHITSDSSTAFADSTYTPSNTAKSLPQMIRQYASSELSSEEPEKPMDLPTPPAQDYTVSETLKRHDDTLKLLKDSIDTVLSCVSSLSEKVEDLSKNQSLFAGSEVVNESNYNSGVFEGGFDNISETPEVTSAVESVANDENAVIGVAETQIVEEVAELKPTEDAMTHTHVETVTEPTSVEEIIAPPESNELQIELQDSDIDGSDILRSFLSDGIGITTVI